MSAVGVGVMLRSLSARSEHKGVNRAIIDWGVTVEIDRHLFGV